MANAWEYPGLNYEQGNYDYFICEVKTFNERLVTYQREVNERLASQDEAITAFKNTVNTQINDLRLETRQFEADLNARFADYTADQNARFVEQMRLLNERLNVINENIYNYLVENLPSIIDEMPQLQDAIIINQTKPVLFTLSASGGTFSISTTNTWEDIVNRLENDTFRAEIVGLTGDRKFVVTNYWYQHNGNQLIMKGIEIADDGTFSTGGKQVSVFQAIYSVVSGSVVQNSFTRTLQPKYIRLSQLVENVAADHSEIITFNPVDLTGYTYYEVVGYGQIVGDVTRYGANAVPANQAKPNVWSTLDNGLVVNLEVYNTSQSTANDITGFVTLLLF